MDGYFMFGCAKVIVMKRVVGLMFVDGVRSVGWLCEYVGIDEVDWHP